MLELFETPLTVLHIFVCFFLILVVLIQPGKSGGLGAALGGAGATQVFGGRGAGNFLSKATWASATTFFLTSVVLAYISSSADDSLESRTGVASIAPAKNDAVRDDKENENAAPANAEDTPLEEGAAADKGAAADEGAADDEGAANDDAPAQPASPEPGGANQPTPNATAAGAANVVAPNAVPSAAPAPLAPKPLTTPTMPAVGKVTPPTGATAVAPKPPVVPAPVVPEAAKPVVPVPPVNPVKPAATPSPAAPPPANPPAAP